MNTAAFRLLLDFLMCDDPSTLFSWTRESLLWHADHEARSRGFSDWIAAYHGVAE